ncbi:FxLYD domain-containing protein [Chromobacterium haemolyticum]|uniref:FxLYD domain-containing protein n=1 Tax=Chromobacterium haemolyticum TaxID=394935 RepID=UPI0011778210|nr:FxLYD domain-containing protein [Chromobacterium haemolyticum]
MIFKYVGAIAIASVLFGCGVREGAPSGETSSSKINSASSSAAISELRKQDAIKSEAPAKDKAQFSSLSFGIGKGKFGVKSVKGTLQNNSDKKYGYVQIEINLYDKDGNQVGSTMANVNNLAPGAKWKYEAPIIEDGVFKAEIINISAF